MERIDDSGKGGEVVRFDRVDPAYDARIPSTAASSLPEPGLPELDIAQGPSPASSSAIPAKELQYLSPVSGRTQRTVLPSPSLRATCRAATRAAPAEMPTRSPSFLTSSTAAR